MNTICFQRTVLLLSLAALAGVSSGFSAVAQTTSTSIDTSPLSSAQSPIPVPAASVFSSAQGRQTQLSQKPSSIFAVAPGELDSYEMSDLLVESAITSDGTAKKQPIPGTAETSASALLGRSASSRIPANPPANAPARKGRQVAQMELAPGRSTRSGSSYIGVGGNLGLTGDTALGDTGFAIFSKIGLTRVFSVRPSVVIGDDTDFIIPVTYDFPIQAEPFERINFAPYVGAGVIISTDAGSNVGFALTGGVDVPISEQFTATAAVTAGFIDTTDLGIMLGIGYNFGTGFRFR
ncbi:hypothetical protein [Argonema galeatum]|uniref:hypothetical protein n=1 Tax=Argonema galeatum TaxID=2942762 RepID=UPI002013B344|nr:hypothetical protein [Argonema galeatum]MCL1467413.1 hypothetical protein [Argonema galeatum A003/A1]